MTKQDLQKSIQSIGRSLKLGFGKAGKLHPVVLATIAATDKAHKTGYKQQPIKWWLVRFTNELITGSGITYPMNDKGEPISYKTIINKADDYPAKLVDVAHYLNNFQSYLYSKKLVQAVKQQPSDKTSPGKSVEEESTGNVVANDALLKQFQALLSKAQGLEEKKQVAAVKALTTAAKQFGISGLSI